MAAVVQINNVDAGAQSLYVTGFIILSGNYPTGGDVLNFATALADPSFVGLVPSVISFSCLNMDVWSMNGSSINGANSTGYTSVVTRAGTPATINPATGIKLKVAALSATPSTEHAAASYEAQYTGDVIAFMAEFTKLI
jgi:hypothetical protein